MSTRNLYLSQKLGKTFDEQRPTLGQISSLVSIIETSPEFKELKSSDVFSKIDTFTLKQYKYFYACLFSGDYGRCKELLKI